MKISPDGSLDGWLSAIIGAAGQLDWDAGNRVKNRKHGVESSEVESLFHRTIFLAGRRTTSRAGCFSERPMLGVGWR